jgi:two-component system sensor histidine kinase KdpD
MAITSAPLMWPHSAARPRVPESSRRPRLQVGPAETGSSSRVSEQPVREASGLSISMVAHELRAPLASLARASELLVEDLNVLDQGQIRSMLSVIREGTLWLQALVENLLCAASMRAGRFQVQTRPTSMLDVVLDVQSTVEPLLMQKDQRLQLSSRKGLPDVAVDRRWISQVLVNLIANASKYSPPGKPIAVGLTAVGDHVRVTVADRGPGIPAKSRARLFQPYYRGADAVQSDRGGLGLGLAIVKLIVDAHDGRVGADNRPAGGARVWFELAALADLA